MDNSKGFTNFFLVAAHKTEKHTSPATEDKKKRSCKVFYMLKHLPWQPPLQPSRLAHLRNIYLAFAFKCFVNGRYDEVEVAHLLKNIDFHYF